MTSVAFGYCTLILIGGFVAWCYRIDIVTQLRFFERVGHIIRIEKRFSKELKGWIK